MLVNPLLLSNTDGRRFAVGLHWKRIVTASLASSEVQALRYAREYGATHVVFTRGLRGEVAAVGCAVLPRDVSTVLSLANAICLQQEGSGRVLTAIALDDEQAWVCGVADGLMVNGFDQVLALADVASRAEEFVRRYPEGAIHHQGALLDSNSTLSLPDLFELAVAHEPECLLRPLHSRWGIRHPLGASGLAICLAGILYFAFHTYRQHQAEQRASAEGVALSPAVSAGQAWAKLVADWERKADLAEPTALNLLLESIGRVPLELAHWQAVQVRCTRQRARWACSVKYDRRVDRRATTDGFLRLLPPTWTTDGGSLNTITARFGLDAPVMQRLKGLELPLVQDVSLAVLKQLQQDSRAFSSVDLGPAVAVKLGTPTDGEGHAMTVDPNIVKPQIVSRSVLVAGPLRSLYVLEGLPISWNTLQVDIASGQVEQADLTSSCLTVREARGEIHAQL